MNFGPKKLRSEHRYAVAASVRPPKESLTEIRNDARRERLLDMELRLRPYRIACFAILGLVLAANSSQIGWWWTVPLAAGLAGFTVAEASRRTAPDRPSGSRRRGGSFPC